MAVNPAMRDRSLSNKDRQSVKKTYKKTVKQARQKNTAKKQETVAKKAVESLGPMGAGLDGSFSVRLGRLFDAVKAQGGTLSMSDGFRTRAQQAAAYANKPGLAAPPGGSWHERGLAADIGGDLQLAHQLAPRFGLRFPMGYEPWHIQPVEVKGTPNNPQGGDSSVGAPDDWPGGQVVGIDPTRGVVQVDPTAQDAGDSAIQALQEVMGIPDLSGIADGLEIMTPLSPNPDEEDEEDDLLNGMNDWEESLINSDPRVSQYEQIFQEAGQQYNIDPRILMAVADAESGFRPEVVSGEVASPAGAQGLMQFMPDTAKGLGIDPLDPQQAIYGAAQLLSNYMQQYGSLDMALAAYNAGPGRVQQYGGVPPFQETQNYVEKIKQRLNYGGAYNGEIL